MTEKMTAEEFLNDQHAYYEVLKDKGVLRVVHSIMEQYAKLKVSEACKKQREICAGYFKQGDIIQYALRNIILRAPEPEDER